jgi:hypothetical protein
METKTTVDLDISDDATERRLRSDYHAWQFFSYAHLPPHLQQISKPFHDHARAMLLGLPRNAETTKMLNKLLEAKDCAVRALLAK